MANFLAGLFLGIVTMLFAAIFIGWNIERKDANGPL